MQVVIVVLNGVACACSSRLRRWYALNQLVRRQGSRSS